jgi:hypothetical protein
MGTTSRVRIAAGLCLLVLGCGVQPAEVEDAEPVTPVAPVAADLASYSDAVASTSGSVYDFYPLQDAVYAICSSPGACPWRGENFESYTNGAAVECDNANTRQAHLEVTSGCLYAKYVGVYRRGWTASSVFRVLAQAYSGGKKVGWRDIAGTYRGWISGWHAGAPAWAGFHVFARYQTENDLYVASYRKDGIVTIKKKVGGTYTTLRQKQIAVPQVGTWYTLRFRVTGQTLALYVNGTLQLTATDSALTWGTTGIRVDYADAYLDDWRADVP